MSTGGIIGDRAERRRRQRRERYADDPTYRRKCLAAALVWRRANPEKVKVADRRKHLRRHHGLTPEQFTRLYRKQGGMCAICFGTNPSRSLHVDHDHKTGKRRGLLCRICNAYLGRIKDSKRLAKRLYRYLEGSL